MVLVLLFIIIIIIVIIIIIINIVIIMNIIISMVMTINTKVIVMEFCVRPPSRLASPECRRPSYKMIMIIMIIIITLLLFILLLSLVLLLLLLLLLLFVCYRFSSRERVLIWQSNHMHQYSPPGTQGRQPGKPEAGTLRAVTRKETRQPARQTRGSTQADSCFKGVHPSLTMGSKLSARGFLVRVLSPRVRESGMRHTVISDSLIGLCSTTVRIYMNIPVHVH